MVYSEASEKGWIRLRISIFYEIKTAHKIDSRYSTSGKTKLFFLINRQDSKKKKKKKKKEAQSVGKINIILFDS